MATAAPTSHRWPRLPISCPLAVAPLATAWICIRRPRGGQRPPELHPHPSACAHLSFIRWRAHGASSVGSRMAAHPVSRRGLPCARRQLLPRRTAPSRRSGQGVIHGERMGGSGDISILTDGSGGSLHRRPSNLRWRPGSGAARPEPCPNSDARHPVVVWPSCDSAPHDRARYSGSSDPAPYLRR